MTGGFQPEPGPGLPPVKPPIPPEGIQIVTTGTEFKHVPGRGLNGHAELALKGCRERARMYRHNHDLSHALHGEQFEQARPGVFRRVGETKIAYTQCLDCGEPEPLMFMVDEDYWLHVGLKDGIICIPCYEKRLGRPLHILDLKPCAINEAIFYGYLMGYKDGHAAGGVEESR